jgi:putative ABC transport system ATP-binding protein
VIRLSAITRSFVEDGRELEVLRGVDLSVSPGEVVAVMGASGSGKSTLLAIAGALDAGFGGEAVVAGQPLRGLSPRALASLRNRSIGFVFQSFNLVPAFPALENVMLPGLLRQGGGEPRDALRARALAALDRVGLSSRVHHFPTQLSGGQQQRVAIARAIVGKPRILLADEPTGNLDSQMGQEIMAILRDLNTAEKTTVVMVTHDARLAEETSRILRLFDGRQVN